MRSFTSIRLCLLATVVAACVAPAALAGPARADAVLHIRGGGDGHGIGLSQYGAYGFAQHGRDYTWILRHYYNGTSLAVLTSEPTVRVLIGDGAAAFAGAAAASGVKLNPAETYTVRLLARGEMALVDSRGKQVARYTGAPLVVSGPGLLQVAGLGAYRGTLEVRPNGAGGVETVDALPLEDYVRGVISAEIPADWSPEALRAQAVAARTYALTTDAGGAVFDQYADTRSQMYRGVAAETPATDAAVSATHLQVVTYQGRPVTTYFFNSSGGATENVENVWPAAKPEPWLRGVRDPYDTAGGDPYHAWARDLSARDAATRLGRLLKGAFIGIRVIRHGFSPRIVTAQVVGSAGTTTVTGERLRSAFGLLTPLASFTTISSRVVSGVPTTGAGGEPGSAQGAAAPVEQALAALVPFVHAVDAATGTVRPEVTGRVYPGAPGASFVLERRGPRGWVPDGGGRLEPDGSFVVAPAAPGVYRIVVNRLAGPAVTVK